MSICNGIARFAIASARKLFSRRSRALVAGVLLLLGGLPFRPEEIKEHMHTMSKAEIIQALERDQQPSETRRAMKNHLTQALIPQHKTAQVLSNLRCYLTRCNRLYLSNDVRSVDVFPDCASDKVVVPLPRPGGTTCGAGEPDVDGVTDVDPAPAPAPALTPEVSTPFEPTDKLASRAIVSLMLKPCAVCEAVRKRSASRARRSSSVKSSSGVTISLNLGSIILMSPHVGPGMITMGYLRKLLESRC